MVGIDSITIFVVFMRRKKTIIGHHLSHCKEADLDPTVTERDLLQVRQLCDENIFTQARDLQQGRVHDSLSYKTVHHLLSVHRHHHVVSVECPSIGFMLMCITVFAGCQGVPRARVGTLLFIR